jgi:hypothetical protein
MKVRTDKIVHSLGTAILYNVAFYHTSSVIESIGIALGVGLVKELIDLGTSKLPESIKKIIRKSYIFSCGGFSDDDLVANGVGIVIGLVAMLFLALGGVFKVNI